MPDNLRDVARAMADDETIISTDLEAASLHLARVIRTAESRNEPIPFISYRSLVVFDIALRLRGIDVLKRISASRSKDDC